MNIIEKLESFQQQLIGVGQTAAACDLQNIIEEYKNAQEPVAYADTWALERLENGATATLHSIKISEDDTPLFTHPPLSDETVKVPEGYVMVPRVPTPEMINAGVMVDRKAWEFGIEHYDRTRSTEALVHNLNRCTDTYKAMIDEAMKADNAEAGKDQQ